MGSISIDTLLMIGLALVTLLGGGATGWLMKPAAVPPPPPAPIIPSGMIDPGNLQTEIQSILAALGKGTTSPTLPGQPAEPLRNQTFHLFSQVLLHLPIASGAKGQAIQKLVGFLDDVFSQRPPATPAQPH